MTKKKKKELNIVDLAKKRDQIEEEQNKVPEFVTEQLEVLLEKAKSNKLKLAIMHFTYDEEEEADTCGGTMIWDRNNNILEVLGLIELMKNVALGSVSEDDF